ncbi:MAG: hypothetical protein AAF443_01370 [Chlamydiota bacterium]
MATTCSLKNNENFMNVIGSSGQGNRQSSSDVLVTLLQNPLDAVYSLNMQSMPPSLGTTANETSANLTTASTGKQPGLSDIFSFQGVLGSLVSIISQSLSQQAQQQNLLAQQLLSEMKDKFDKITAEEKKAAKKKHHAFGHLLLDVCKILSPILGPVELVTLLIVCAVEAAKNHKNYGSELKGFFVNTSENIVENPALPKTIEVLSIIAAVLMIIAGAVDGGASAGIAMLLIAGATQIPIGQQTLVQRTANGIASGLVKAHILKRNAAKLTGDAIALGLSMIASICTGMIGESLSLGMMAAGSSLGSLTPDIAKNMTACIPMKGTARQVFEYTLMSCLALISIAIGMSGGLSMGTEATKAVANGAQEASEVSEIAEQNAEEAASLVRRINNQLKDNTLAKVAKYIGAKICDVLPDAFCQLIQENKVQLLILLTYGQLVTNATNGTLGIAQGIGTIITAKITELVQDMQADITKLTAENQQAEDNIQHIEDNLSKVLEGFQAELSASQMIPAGLTSFSI